MTAGFGVDKGVDGSGTTSADIRQIQGGLYTPGVISGCTITLSPTNMTYTVGPGVVAIKTATGEIVLAPVAQTSVLASNGPGSGTRTDIIYVQQRYPSIEGDANIVIGVGTTLPARALTLRKYIVSAGQTKSELSVPSEGVNYAIPYGATLGRLHYYQHTATGIEGVLPQFQRFGHGSFNLPTDRLIRFKVTAVLSTAGAFGFDNTKYCEYGFIPSINGGDFVLWQTGGLHQAWQTYYFESTFQAPAGPNTVNCAFTKLAGPGTPVGHYGTDGNGYGRRGIEFIVEDIGPVV